jgi:hypothetical protein
MSGEALNQLTLKELRYECEKRYLPLRGRVPFRPATRPDILCPRTFSTHSV